jgi:hypothetical protein
VKIKKQIFPLLISLFLFSVSTSLNAFDQLSNIDATTGRFDYDNSQTPTGIEAVLQTQLYTDNDFFNVTYWTVTIAVDAGDPVVFNGGDFDFSVFFSFEVLRAGTYVALVDNDPIYVVDTEIKITFYDSTSSVSDFEDVTISVEELDPIFSYYDLPSELTVSTNGYDTFIEDDIIDFSEWSFYISLTNSDEIVEIDFDSDYLYISDPGSLVEGPYFVDVYFSVFDIGFGMFDINLSTSVGIIVDPYVPSYSISIFTLPDKLVFFVGDEIDFDGLVITVEDYGTPLENIENEALSFYGDSDGIDYSNQVVEGSFFTSDSSIIDNGKIWIEYQADDGNDFTDFFFIDLYPQNYAVDFTNHPVWSGEISASEIEEVDFGGVSDTWILTGQSNDGSLLELNTNNSADGLMIGDASAPIPNYPTEVSMMSKYLWGTTGSSLGKPMINQIYVRAYSGIGNNATLTVRINNVIIGVEVLPTILTTEWLIFSAIINPIYVGHIELYFEGDGESQINVQDLKIYSYEDLDSYFQMSDMMIILSGIESLDSCINNEAFLEANYDYFIDQVTFHEYESIFNSILLLDQSISGGLKNQLIVTTENKLAMLLLNYVDTDGFSPLLASNRTMDNNITLHYVLGAIFILIQLFWIGRRFSFFDKEIKQ